MPKRKNTAISILHVCGGDPLIPLTKITSRLYSPRMWSNQKQD